MDSLGRSVELAKTKDRLREEVDDLTEDDSVVLIIGVRRTNDEGQAVSMVRTVERNAHGFEAIGLVQVAFNRFRDYYEVYE